MHVLDEKIKVRLGSDVDFKVKFTENGVILPHDLLDGKAKQLNWYIVPELWRENNIYNEGKAYALASTLDPYFLKLAGIQSKPVDNFFILQKQTEFDCSIKDTKGFINKIRRVGNSPVNWIGIQRQTKDIFYSMGGGNIPLRSSVATGAYPKVGKLAQNKWKGLIPHDEMPYVINPDRGYVVSANNFMTSDNVTHGIGHTFTYTGRSTRIYELIDEALERTGNKLTAKDMVSMQTDVVDVYAKHVLANMLYCAYGGMQTLSTED